MFAILLNLRYHNIMPGADGSITADNLLIVGFKGFRSLSLRFYQLTGTGSAPTQSTLPVQTGTRKRVNCSFTSTLPIRVRYEFFHGNVVFGKLQTWAFPMLESCQDFWNTGMILLECSAAFTFTYTRVLYG